MRILGMLLLGAGLLVPGLGCTCTRGVCDCYPPPVETLLVAPAPAHAHPSLGVYGDVNVAPVAPVVAAPGVPAGVQPVPVIPNNVLVK